MAPVAAAAAATKLEKRILVVAGEGHWWVEDAVVMVRKSEMCWKMEVKMGRVCRFEEAVSGKNARQQVLRKLTGLHPRAFLSHHRELGSVAGKTARVP